MTQLQPATDMTTTRRTVLLAGAGGAGAIVLAACSSGGGSNPAAGRANSSNGDETLATLADIRVGQAVIVNLPDGSPAAVARPKSDEAVAFSATCTHQGCTVQAHGAKLDCPCHGSQYDALTGKVLRGPAPRALPRIPVQVTNGKVIASQA